MGLAGDSKVVPFQPATPSPPEPPHPHVIDKGVEEAQQIHDQQIKNRESQMKIDQQMNERVAVEREGQSAKTTTVARGSILVTARPAVEQGNWALFKWHVVKILANQRFDAAIGIVILLNSISIGIVSTFEVQNLYELREDDKIDLSGFEALEHVFLAIYSMELVMRFLSMGLSCLNSNWVKFDFVLVFVGALSSWVIEPILMAQDGGGEGMEALAPLMVLRVMRLLRLARSLRLLVQFKTLWMLVRGLLSSAGTMFYTFALMMLILYVFACLGVELITKDKLLWDDPDVGEIVQYHFKSVIVIMLTLVQFITMDSIGSIYTPIVRKQPYLIAYFIFFLIVVSVSLMNLVTAVIVEGAIEQGHEDKEVQKAYAQKKILKIVPTIKRLFTELDDNGDGTLTLQEVMDAPDEVKEELQKIMQTDQLVMLFELLDTDDSGEITVDEFCNGITKMITSDEPAEFIRLRKQMQQVRAEQRKLSTTVDKRIGNLETTLQSLNANIEKLVQRTEGNPDITSQQVTTGKNASKRTSKQDLLVEVPTELEELLLCEIPSEENDTLAFAMREAQELQARAEQFTKIIKDRLIEAKERAQKNLNWVTPSEARTLHPQLFAPQLGQHLGAGRAPTDHHREAALAHCTDAIRYSHRRWNGYKDGQMVGDESGHDTQ